MTILILQLIEWSKISTLLAHFSKSSQHQRTLICLIDVTRQGVGRITELPGSFQRILVSVLLRLYSKTKTIFFTERGTNNRWSFFSRVIQLELLLKYSAFHTDLAFQNRLRKHEFIFKALNSRNLLCATCYKVTSILSGCDRFFLQAKRGNFARQSMCCLCRNA